MQQYKDFDKDLQLREQDAMCVNESRLENKWHHNLKYLFLGAVFGILPVKGEMLSWFRIQEMFRLQSLHMYGIIGSAVLVGVISVFLIKKFKIKSIYGEKIFIQDKKFNKGQIYGGLLFGFGWALTGGCPGPISHKLVTALPQFWQL